MTLQTAATWLVFMVGAITILTWTVSFVKQKLWPAPPLPVPVPPYAPLPPPDQPQPETKALYCPCPKRGLLSDNPIRTEIHGTTAHLCYLCLMCKSEVKLPTT